MTGDEVAPRLTGDEVRATVLPPLYWGYHRDQVDTWLSEVADCLDAGSQPAMFISPPKFGKDPYTGYDTDAVDRLASALGFSAAAESPDPGRVRQGLRARWDQSVARAKDRRQYVGECDAEWRRVSALPGTRLRWQDVFPKRGTFPTFPDGQLVPKAGRGREHVNPVTGAPVLWVLRRHGYRKDTAVVLLPGGRWLRFPVRGTRLGNAVMTAVNESGTVLMWFRKVGPAGDWRGPAAVEVIVSPECDMTAEMLFVALMGTGWLVDYFTIGP